MSLRIPGRRFLLASLALPLLVSSAAPAKEYDPYMMYVYPAGGQRGTTVEAMARGRGLEGASEVRVSGGGVTGKVLAVEDPDTRLNQRSANRLDQSENPNVVQMSLTIAPDAEPGARDLWIITPKGATNRFKFVVGQVPEVNEDDENNKNDELDGAQSLAALPILVNGQIDQGDRDIFRFTARAGQTLVCEFQGQTLLPYIADAVPGWLQACLTLYDATGAELAYVDDWRFRPDPLLIHEVKTDGQYLIEVKDTLFRGREDMVYRLGIGALPFITHIYPLGAQRDTDALVEVHGVNLPAASTNFAIPGDSPPLRRVRLTAGGLTSNALPFAIGDHPEAQEAEPNDAVEQANKIETPVTINGRIQQSGDADYFVFSAKANDVIVMDVRARRLESSLDSLVTLFTARGQQLAENDDTMDASQGLMTHHADSYLSYTIRADGDYVLRLGDVQSQGGQEYAYRLTIAPPQPDFDLRVFPANLSVARGGSAVAKVKAYRRDGFNGEIGVTVAGLPPGFVASDVVVAAGQKEAGFTFTAPADAPLGVVSPTVQGKAKIGEQEIVRTAFPAEELMQAFYYWHDVPTDEFLLAAVEPISFTLSTDSPPTQVHEVARGGNLSVVVRVSREGLQAALAKAEAEKQAAEQALAKVKDELDKAKTAYDAAEKAARTAQAAGAKDAPEKRRLADAARAKRDGLPAQERAATAKVAEAAKKIEDVKKAKTSVISLKAETPPRGVTVRPANIPAGQNEATVAVSVTPQAAVGLRQNIILTASLKAGTETFGGVAPAIPLKVITAQ
jgi:hypothetical protein